MRIKGCFRVMGKALVPEDVSLLLELVPDESHRSGDRNIGKDGRAYAPFAEGAWILNSKNTAQTIDDLLIEFTTTLSPRSAGLRELTANGYRIDLFIYLGSDEEAFGFELSPTTLAQLSTLGVTASFDIYFVEAASEGG